jgi:Rad3-related DNA helicase
LPSPFPKENFDLMLAPKVSVRYKDRGQSYPEVAEYLKRFVAGKIGNYFIYFPSYEYLENVSGPILLLKERTSWCKIGR